MRSPKDDRGELPKVIGCEELKGMQEGKEKFKQMLKSLEALRTWEQLNTKFDTVENNTLSYFQKP